MTFFRDNVRFRRKGSLALVSESGLTEAGQACEAKQGKDKIRGRRLGISSW